MKNFFNNKRNIIISVVSLVLVVAIVIVAVTFNNNKIDVDNSTTTSTTTQATGDEVGVDGTTTENVTEESSETSDKTQEEDETKNNEANTDKAENVTSKPNRNETTTKKPNKTETTTKKPTSKPETTTKATDSDKVPEDIAREWMYEDYGGKEGYEAHLKEVAKYKCSICGDHNCPSLDYGADVLGNPDFPSLSTEKCPAIINGTAKCDYCGKTLVSSSDDRWLEEPDKYCDGWCQVDFG